MNTSGEKLASAQPPKAERRFFLTAKAFTGTAKPSHHTPAWCNSAVGSSTRTTGCSDGVAGSFTGVAGGFIRMAGGFIQTGKSVIRTAGGSSHTDKPFIHMVEGASHTHKSSNHTHKSFIRMVERFIHTHKCSNHTNKPSSQTNNSFIGAGKWSSRTGFAPKPAESGKKDPFSRSDRARWSKIDSAGRGTESRSSAAVQFGVSLAGGQGQGGAAT